MVICKGLHIKKKFLPAFAAYKAFLQASEDLRQYEGMNYTEGSVASGNYGVLFSLSSIAVSFGAHSFFSKDDANIVTELEKGKIVIVQTSLMSKTMVNTIFSSALLTLTKRARLKNKKPVSVFVDEAYRVVNKDTELAGDILRESAVELIMSIQNEAQMIEKMGENRYKELKGHLTQRFVFRNNDEYHAFKLNIEPQKLETHSYFDEQAEEIFSTKPIFFEEHKMMLTEKKYQTGNPSLRCYDGQVAVLNDVLYESQKQIYLYDLKTKIYKTETFVDFDEKTELSNGFDEFLNLHSQNDERGFQFGVNINSHYDIFI